MIPLAVVKNVDTEGVLKSDSLIPGCFVTAPQAVVMPQPRRQTFSSGAFGSTATTDTSATTVYCEKVEVPIWGSQRLHLGLSRKPLKEGLTKWWIGWPLMLKRLVLSGISPCPWVPRTGRKHSSVVSEPGIGKARMIPTFTAKICLSTLAEL